jgi:hypothetical protein
MQYNTVPWGGKAYDIILLQDYIMTRLTNVM